MICFCSLLLRLCLTYSTFTSTSCTGKMTISNLKTDSISFINIFGTYHDLPCTYTTDIFYLRTYTALNFLSEVIPFVTISHPYPLTRSFEGERIILLFNLVMPALLCQHPWVIQGSREEDSIQIDLRIQRHAVLTSQTHIS